MISSCLHKAYKEESFAFNNSTLEFFQSFSKMDTLFFQSKNHNVDTFVITKIDSVLKNTKGYFINSRPFKELFLTYKQIPIDYWAESRVEMAGTSSERKVKEDARLITITTYPDNNSTEIYISFKNFRSLIKNNNYLIPINYDTIKVNGSWFTNYYKINSTKNSLLIDSNDIETIYVNQKDGFIAFKEKNGKIWLRK